MESTSRTEISPGLLAGRLEGISLPDLMWALSRRRKTGVLQIHNGRVRKTLYIQEGRIVFAVSSDPNERLGEILLRRGQISLDQLEQALTKLPTGKRLGALLVEAGHLTPDELVTAVLKQVKSVVLDVISWEEGEYHFMEGPLPTQEVITLQVGTSELLLQGIRRLPSFSRIRRSVGAGRAVYGLTEQWFEAVEGLQLTEGEALLLERLKSSDESVENLCREVFLSNFEIYQTLWAFKVLGIVRERDKSWSVQPESTRAGHFEAGGFASILVELGRFRETGVLHVNRRAHERTFHITGGRLVFATSNSSDDGLVSFLLRRGVISLQDREETAKRLLSNKRVGTILREMGVIDELDLREMVRQQISEIVYDTFRWGDSEYAFVPEELPSNEEITLDLGMEVLVAEGLRRVTSWTDIIKGCGGMDTPLALTPQYLEVLDAMHAGVEEWRVVNTLRSPQSPRRICPTLAMGDFRVCQTLWSLVLLGAVQVSSAERVDEILEAAPAQASSAPQPPAGRWLSEETSEIEAWSEPAEQPVSTPEPCAPADEARHHGAMELLEPEGASEQPLPPPIEAVQTLRMSREEVESALGIRRESEELLTVREQRPAAVREHEPAAASAAAEPAGPAWAPSAGLDELIGRFNAMHQVIYRLVRAEIGAGAINFVRSCCAKPAVSGVDPLSGATLRADGSWDQQSLKRAVEEQRIDDPWPMYQRLIDREMDLLRAHLGEATTARLRREIEEIEKAELPRRA